MTQDLDIAQLEAGSAFAYLKLGLALKQGDRAVSQAHINAMVAGLNAGETMESRVYFSPDKGQFLYLPPLSGPPLFAALYAFSKALLCKPFAAAMREVLKKWVDGDARAVGLAMTVLKWGADQKSSVPPEPKDQSLPPKPPQRNGTADPLAMLDPRETSDLLRGDDPNTWSKAVETLHRVAVLDGKALQPVLPALVDALAKEYRDQVLHVLSAGVRTGLDLNPVMPVLAGLLLDRDYYDAETVGRLYQCLIAVAESGGDLSPAWPYICFCMDEKDLKLKLLLAGAARGLSVKYALEYILPFLHMPIVPAPTDDPLEFSLKLESAAPALEILAIGAWRDDFTPADLEAPVP